MDTSIRPDTVLLGADSPLPLDAPFTPESAEALGVPRRRLRNLVERGLVRRVTRGVYAAAQAPSTQEFRAAALALVLAPSAVVTDRTAAWLHGVDLNTRGADRMLPPISVFQRPGTRSGRPGTTGGERTLAPGDVTVIDGVRVTTRLRTACDLGRLLYRFDALAALDAFLAIGVDQDTLVAEVQRFRGQRGVVQLRTLALICDGRAESVAESWLRLYWLDAGLPAPEPQWWVLDHDGVPVFRLDLALPEIRFGAEYDGEEHHTSSADRAHDLRRRSWLDVEGEWHLEVFTKQDVFARRGDPSQRLHRGLVLARRRLMLPTSYPTLGPGPERP